jgi:hypothetical protein
MILPSRLEFDMEKIGVVLAEIIDIEVVEKNNTKYLRLFIEVSNFKVKKQRISTNLFYKGYGVTAEEFLKFMGTNEKSILIGQLFYCEIDKKQSGYDTIKNLFMKPETECLYFDPRKTVAPFLRRMTEESFGLDDIFG